MSLKSFFTALLHPTKGTIVSKIELSLVSHAVAIAKADTGLVGKIEAQIEAANADASLTTGSAKLAFVAKAAVDDVVAFVDNPAAAAADVEDFTIELVQSVFDDAVSSTAGNVASLIVTKAADAAIDAA